MSIDVGGIARREYRALCTAEALSAVGDQLAKVAVALLVFRETGSAAYSGLAYGLSFLTPLVSAPLLSGLADRFPRRTVMMVCCLLQACFLTLMAWPGVSIVLLVAGTMAVSAINVPFKAAQGALLRSVLGKAGNTSGRATFIMIREIGQLGGLAVGAAVVAALGTSNSLLLDAATFVVAAVIMRSWVTHRLGSRAASDVAGRRPLGALWQLMRRDQGLRVLVAFLSLIGLCAAPTAVIVPLIDHARLPTWTLGPLLAADALGAIAGTALLKRRTVDQQRALLAPLALVAFAAQACFVFGPAQPLLLGALLVVSGFGQAYFAIAIGESVNRIPDELSGLTNGMLNMVLRVTQGLGAIAAGLLAQLLTPATAVALLGAVGIPFVGLLALRWRQAPESGVAV